MCKEVVGYVSELLCSSSLAWGLLDGILSLSSRSFICFVAGA